MCQAFHASRPTIMHMYADCFLPNSLSRDDLQPSPTASTHATRGGLSPTSTMSDLSSKERRLSDLGNYRRDLAVLEPSRAIPVQQPSQHQPQPQYRHQLASQVAPWMAPSSSAPSHSLPLSFYNGSSDSLPASQGLTPSGSRSGMGHLGASFDSPDGIYYGDSGRRPSAASVNTTASSQGSKASVPRGGFRKLQGFFGEEFPGRDSSDGSTPASLPGGNAGAASIAGKDQRSRSYSHTRPPQRDRNYSNATDREASPASSRPRTPVPSADVVPFLYQDNTVSAVHFVAFSLVSCLLSLTPFALPLLLFSLTSLYGMSRLFLAHSNHVLGYSQFYGYSHFIYFPGRPSGL